MNLTGLTVAMVGLLVLLTAVAHAHGSTIPTWEAALFRRVNRLPGWLYPVLWGPMQLGNLAVGTAAGVLIGWLADAVLVAVGAVLAAVAKLGIERVIRHEMHEYLAVRTRPGTSQPGAILRGDVPASGPSFPSGHIILVAAVAVVVVPAIPLSLRWIPLLAITLTMLGRVYVGAHNPLDVVAGLGAGLLAGGAILAVGG